MRSAVNHDDNNYQFSTFMTLALAKELQLRQGMSETEELRLVLVDFQDAKFGEDDWGNVFAETFGMQPEEFYATLNSTRSPHPRSRGTKVTSLMPAL